MAFTFPLSIQEFSVRLQPFVSDFRWYLDRFEEVSGTGIGQVLTAEMAPAKWRAPVVLRRMLQTEAADIQATIELLEGRGAEGTFDLYDLRKAGPQADRNGAIIAGEDPILHSVGSTSLRVQLLPTHYKLTRGDMLSVVYGSAPVRRALYRILETVTASSAGLTPAFEVEPAVKAGTAVGNAVGLYQPRARMMIQPRSFSVAGTDGRFVRGMSFTAIEVR